MSLFITIEGGEGSGKSSVSEFLVKELKSKGYDVITTREPGGIKISEDIRNIILDRENKHLDPKTEALLFAAARRQHLVEKVLPALNNKTIVICDRFIDSSLVYQGITRGLGLENIYELNKFAIDDFLPDLTILLSVKPEVGLSRVFSNEREVNRLDLESLEFHKKVFAGYKEVASLYPKRIKEIDASKSLSKVKEEALKILLNKLEGK